MNFRVSGCHKIFGREEKPLNFRPPDVPPSAFGRES
jgi:hypothetical protein